MTQTPSKTPTTPQPTVAPKLEEPKLGFNRYAERLNGRAAMVGFVIALAIEYFTGQGVLSWLGLY
jgi:Chlorophyll A-B binding protein